METKHIGSTRKGEYTQEDVRKAAIKEYWKSIKDMVRYRSCHVPPCFDHRYAFDIEVEREYWKMAGDLKYYKDARIMENKQRVRQESRKGCEFRNILQNPLVKDYLRHHRYHTYVLYPTHINWGHRKHWAKCEKDIKILEIFIKCNKERKLLNG